MAQVTTYTELYDYVLEGINKEETGSLTDTEFEVLINDAQYEYLTTRAEQAELGQKRTDDLRSLKRQTIFILAPPAYILDFQDTAVELIDDTPAVAGQHGYFRMLNVAVELYYKNNPCYSDGVQVPELWHKTKPVNSDKLMEIRRDYYNRPTDERLYYDLRGDIALLSRTVMEVITDTDSTANRIRLEYFVHPRTILRTNNTIAGIDLPLHARREVCEIAIRKYIDRMESPRYQTQLYEKSIAVE